MPQIRKSYERFNVGAMMKARRQAKEEAAIGHKSVQQLLPKKGVKQGGKLVLVS